MTIHDIKVDFMQTGIPQRTLKDWHYKKPEAFKKLCLLVAIKEGKNEQVRQTSTDVD